MIIQKIDPKLKIRDISDAVQSLPKIITVTSFDDSGVSSFLTDLQTEINNDLTEKIIIKIDSFGGTIYSLMAMIDAIDSCPKPIVTWASGKAMSCGAVLFSMGQERYISPYATIMIHDASTGHWGKVEEMKSGAEQLDKLNKLLWERVAVNINKNEDFILNMIHEKSHADWHLDAKEAKKINLATKIGSPRYEISLDVSCKVTV